VDPDGTLIAAEITLLLAEGAEGAPVDTEKVKRGLTLVFQHWARPVFAILRGNYSPAELPPGDFPDLWQDTIRDLTRLVWQGGVRKEGSLFSLVCTITRRRAERHVKWRASHQTVNLVDDLEVSCDRRPWADLNGSERNEVFELMRAAIPTLPPKAGIVIRVFIEHFPETESMERLRELVSKVTCKEETLAAVKRGLQDGREALREVLRRKGYEFRTGGTL